ncbi:30S ribosomal protein S6 [Candidatus Binatia bacterium]|nr:30S ribosomal protein S6 [Candidatus Binatia bacterium]
MVKYETMFVLQPELPEAQVRETIDRVRRLIEGMGGEVADVQDWGVRELAYQIGKHSRGTYVLAHYAARPEVVKELERTFKIADEVLRFISVRMNETRTSARPEPRESAITEGAATEAEAVDTAAPDQGN